MEIEIRGADGEILPDRGIGKVFVRGASVMHSYFRDEESTEACLSDDGWLDTGDMGYMSDGYIFIVGRAKDMIIINGRNHWPQDIEWAVEQLPGFKSGDIAAFAITGPSGEETPAVLVHCRVSDAEERGRLRDEIRERVRAITGITPGRRAGPAAHPAAHQLGQAVAHQGAQPLSVRRNPALRHRRLSSGPANSRQAGDPQDQPEQRRGRNALVVPCCLGQGETFGRDDHRRGEFFERQRRLALDDREIPVENAAGAFQSHARRSHPGHRCAAWGCCAIRSPAPRPARRRDSSGRFRSTGRSPAWRMSAEFVASSMISLSRSAFCRSVRVNSTQRSSSLLSKWA